MKNSKKNLKLILKKKFSEKFVTQLTYYNQTFKEVRLSHAKLSCIFKSLSSKNFSHKQNDKNLVVLIYTFDSSSIFEFNPVGVILK